MLSPFKAYPLDTVKRVLMVEPGRYPSWWRCLVGLVNEAGLSRLWRGNVSNCLRVWTNGIVLALFDSLISLTTCYAKY